MSKIPKIFKPDMEFVDNNKKAFYSYLEDCDDIESESFTDGLSVDDFFNKVSNSGKYVFNKSVVIITKDKKYNTKIAGKFGNRVITLDGDTINADDIIKIYEKNK